MGYRDSLVLFWRCLKFLGKLIERVSFQNGILELFGISFSIIEI